MHVSLVSCYVHARYIIKAHIVILIDVNTYNGYKCKKLSLLTREIARKIKHSNNLIFFRRETFSIQ